MNAVLLQCTSKHSEMMPLKRGAALPSSEDAGGGWYLCTDRTSKTRKRAPTLSDSACEIRPVGRSKTQFISTAQRSVSVSVGQTMRSFSSCNKNNFAFLHCSENIDIKNEIEWVLLDERRRNTSFSTMWRTLSSGTQRRCLSFAQAGSRWGRSHQFIFEFDRLVKRANEMRRLH